MSTRIRLRRMGSKKRPFFRVVVADQRTPRDGRFIENIGKYHPLEDPSLIDIDQERALHWLRVGAQPSNQVRTLMRKVGIWEEFVKERPSAGTVPSRERAQKERVSQKAKQKAEAATEAPPVPEASAAPPPAPPPAPAAEAVEPEAAAPEPEAAEPEAAAPEAEPEVTEASAAEAVEAATGAPEPEATADEAGTEATEAETTEAE
ncbi:MAG TPA: 30S ribosomal protein S16 [Actinomycetota bacterium]